MRIIAAALAPLLLMASPLYGQQIPFRPPQLPPPTQEPAQPAARPAPTVDSLLEELAMADSDRDARNLEERIRTLWSRSGSPTADLLLERSNKALEEDDTDTAEELLVKLTELAPDFAEGWHQRAIVSMHKENFEDAVAALRHALSLQPKHFVALAELASILEEFGDEASALTAYREAIRLDPFIEGVDDRIRDLSRNVEGQGI